MSDSIAHQASPSMGLSRQEYWSGLPFPSPGDLPEPGIEPGFPALEADALTSQPPCKLSLLSIHFPGGSEVKASASNAGDLGSIPGSGRSPGEGNGNPLQYSCLENPMDGGAWWATVHGVTKSRTRLNDLTFTFTLSYSTL